MTRATITAVAAAGLHDPVLESDLDAGMRPARIDRYYDRRLRSWRTMLVTEYGAQIGTALYDGTRADADASAAQLQRVIDNLPPDHTDTCGAACMPDDPYYAWRCDCPCHTPQHQYVPGIASDRCQFRLDGRTSCLRPAAEHEGPPEDPTPPEPRTITGKTEEMIRAKGGIFLPPHGSTFVTTEELEARAAGRSLVETADAVLGEAVGDPDPRDGRPEMEPASAFEPEDPESRDADLAAGHEEDPDEEDPDEEAPDDLPEHLREAVEAAVEAFDDLARALNREGGRDSSIPSVRHFAAYHLADIEGNDGGAGWLAGNLLADALRELVR